MRKEYLHNNIQIILPAQSPSPEIPSPEIIADGLVGLLTARCGGCTSWSARGEWEGPGSKWFREEVTVYEASSTDPLFDLADEMASYLLDVTDEEAIYIKVNNQAIIFHRE